MNIETFLYRFGSASNEFVKPNSKYGNSQSIFSKNLFYKLLSFLLQILVKGIGDFSPNRNLCMTNSVLAIPKVIKNTAYLI